MSEPPKGGKGERGRASDRRGGWPGRPGPRKGGPPPSQSGKRPSSIGLARVGGEDFELVHPRGVKEMELDYEEGMELWKAGDPESARDALRYALAACHDNLWIHTALGRIALEEFHDPSLARGHFGYAVELGRKALPPNFGGRLSPDRAANRPFLEAIEGLLRCLEALGRPEDVRQLRGLRDRLSSGASGSSAKGRE
jgi:hypothetical protein